MAKVITHDLEKLLEGVYETVDFAKGTIGPKGRNVVLSNGDIVNDGKKAVDDVQFKDPAMQKGANKVKNLVNKISMDVGGGRTATAILFKELLKEGSKLLDKGQNANLIKKGMKLAVKDIHAELEKLSRPAKTKDLERVATISTESEELGKVIAEVVGKVGKDGVVTVEESSATGITTTVAEGLKFDRGWLSPYMVTDKERMESVLEDVPVAIFDKKIATFMDVKPIIDKFVEKKMPTLFLIAEDVDESVLKAFAFMRFNGLTNVLAIKTPGVGDLKKFCIEDLCALTGAEVITDITKVTLGRARKVISKKDSTEIRGGKDIKTWITTLKTRMEMTENKWEKDQYLERIAKLQNGIAVIKVGSTSSDEVKYLKLKIEDGVNETKRALEEGVVMGGNCAFLHVFKGEDRKDSQFRFQMYTDLPEEARKGYNLVVKGVQAPLRQIVENCGDSPDVIISKIMESKSLTTGYNALQNEIVEDMQAEGIIDAVKVVKSVLEYAVNEASLILTCGADNSELLEDNK